MHLNPPSGALDPSFRHTAVVSGIRRETGAAASRTLSLRARCCVLGGESVDQSSNAAAPTNMRQYTILLRRTDWPDHLPPQSGDSFLIESYPDMRVQQVNRFSADIWALTCLSKDYVP
jgi:hypothetical protein